MTPIEDGDERGPSPALAAERGRGRVDRLAARLTDARAGRVVLVSHCLLNENSRYLGGAGRRGCVREVVDACADAGLGVVQIQCPEQRVWGGVLKRHMLRGYGSAALRHRALRWALLLVVLGYTRWRYRRLAREVAGQVADYRRSGWDVTAVVAVDGSPSCGLNQTLNTADAVHRLAAIDLTTVTTEEVNAIVRDAVCPRSGMYTDALRRRLDLLGPEVPFLAHDLIAELDARRSPVAAAITRLAVREPAPESDAPRSAPWGDSGSSAGTAARQRGGNAPRM